jgi:hypothetical protein
MTEAPLKVLPLDPTRVRQESHTWRVHQVIAPKGTPVEMLLEPSFWRGCTAKVGRHDRLEVTTDDGEYFAELMVLGLDPGNGLIVQALRGVALLEVAGLFDNVAQPNRRNLQGRYGGPHRKWCVVNPGGRVIAEGLPDAIAVRTWIDNYERAQDKGSAA